METTTDTPQTEIQPWWAKAIDRWGIATLFALVLLWHVLYGDKNDNIAVVQKTLEQHVQDMRIDAAENRWYLRALCLNTAKDDTARAGCVPPQNAR
jgi:hypothetical protein